MTGMCCMSGYVINCDIAYNTTITSVDPLVDQNLDSQMTTFTGEL